MYLKEEIHKKKQMLCDLLTGQSSLERNTQVKLNYPLCMSLSIIPLSV